MLSLLEPAATRSIPGFCEPVAALSHLAGALVFGLLSLALLGRGWGDRRRVLALAVFAFSGVLLLLLSGIYHMQSEGTAAREILGRLDRAAIFVLIAGTHTPIQGFFFRGTARWAVLAGMWTLVAIGIVLFSVLFPGLPDGLGTAIYLALGWLAGSFGLVVWHRYGTRKIWPLIVGGLTYTVGAILMTVEWPTLIPGIFGPHELWHVSVLAALSLHWAFLFKHARHSMGS